MSVQRFKYQRITQFYETDAMGIIHHANYLLYFEEARLDFIRRVWAADSDESRLKHINYPLIHASVDYRSSVHFNEPMEIEYEVSVERAKLIFDYTLNTKSFNKPSAFGKTIHVAFDMNKKQTVRLPKAMLDFLGIKGN